MSSSQQTTLTTRRFARVLGPYVTIITVVAISRASAMRTLMTDFRANSAWPWVTGAFVLLSGLIVVALHPYWRGAPAVIVSTLGWLTVLKGVFLMTVPYGYMSFADSVAGAFDWWRAGFVVIALLGVYLTFVGWMPTPSRQVEQPTHSAPDIPRAA
ncbi:hypothetical protein BST27_07680 [Mycobacterium intermedium]|uniref:Uncharacterized protein n=1 Tax=Mycobacterium intermedium TaxID=28445 RepID=A0A1E3SCT5_MYCIE|nr:hypothetical protein [Mycobacterium intermedium]MCV6966551.1 hypothetical protein [Mycobacterium intermedium]ODQ99929.1 hypothetical protein BHQ20_15115 [Mycobacterium intermedium]OPE49795.1 hypothetical protein BV508_12685 [Mycobacterium intermedium]ORB08261.1 hypothetical protein BST27_07680 [Mycobacterium intermedium]